MRKINILILFTLLSNLIFAQKTELIVIGTIHQPVPNFNSDTIVKILDTVKPDFILNELYSSFFTKDFKFKNQPTENEGIASEKYTSKYPNVQLRPFDFEGRNEYRRINGFNPTEGLAISLLDSLYQNKLLTKKQSKIYDKYQNLLEPLKKSALGDPKEFNNSKNDKICKERQYYQYVKLLKIMKERPEFTNHTYTKPNGEIITYEKGFQLASEFWDDRNQTMAKNILKIANENPNTKIVVLTGFMHRYYIRSELKKMTKNNENIVIKEFYEE